MIFTAFITGFRRLCRRARLVGWLYALNFGFAIIVALPLQSLLENKVGQSLGIQRLMPNFDYTIVQDFMREYGSEVAVILQQAQFVILLYFVFAIFLVGGILEKVRYSTERTFIQGCATHFWRLLRLTVYFVLIYVLLLLLLGGIFQQIYIENFANFNSERPVVQGAVIFGSVFLLLSIVVATVQDYAKIQIVHQPTQSVFKTFWLTWRLVLRNLSLTFPLYLLNVLLLAICFGLYWWLSGYLHPVNTGLNILLTFLLSQLFVLLRIALKLLNLASATTLYEKIMIRQRAD